MLRIARQSKKTYKDIVEMPCIHGKNGNTKVNLKDKMEVWKEYEDKLLNEENKSSGALIVDLNEGPFENVSVKIVVEELNQMKARKAVGPNGITSELQRVCKNRV